MDDPVPIALGRVHGALDFIARLAYRAKELGQLQGTIFQVPKLPAPVPLRPSPPRHNGCARPSTFECAATSQALTARNAAIELQRQEQDGVSAENPAAEPALRTQRSRQGMRVPPEDGGGILGMDKAETEHLAAAAAALCKLLRVKVEDDQDIVTAQQALAECGHFFVKLQAEAAERGVSETELLRKCELGEA